MHACYSTYSSLQFHKKKTQVRLRAWAQSFAIWLVLKVLFVSSSVVLFMHVLLPSLIMKGVHHIQIKLVGNIKKEFYKEIQRKTKLKYAVKGSTDDNADFMIVHEETEFNVAKYPCLSHRLASIIADNDTNHRSSNNYEASSIADMILHFVHYSLAEAVLSTTQQC